MGDALRGGQVVLCRRRGRRDLLVLEGVQQVLAAVLFVAVLDDGPQRLRPGHLWGRRTSAHVNIRGGKKKYEKKKKWILGLIRILTLSIMNEFTHLKYIGIFF